MSTAKTHPAAFDHSSSPIPPGLTLIEASAGTGKTYAISHLVPRLVLEGTVEKIEQIVLVTFTKDAARELSDRVRRVMALLAAPKSNDEEEKEPGVAQLRRAYSASPAAQARLQRAMRDIDKLVVSTIHSFCQRVLQQEGTLCGLPTIPDLIAEAGDLVNEAVHDLWQRHIVPDPLLARIAQHAGLDVGDNIGFTSRMLALDEPEYMPPSDDWEGLLAKVRTHMHSLPAFQDDVRTTLASQGADVLTPKGLGLLASYTKPLRQPDDFAGILEDLRDTLALGRCFSSAKGKQASVAAFTSGASWQACTGTEDLLAELRWAWGIKCAKDAAGWISRTLSERRQITYDGIITVLHQALMHSPTRGLLRERLGARHLVGIIDESQDTDPKQFDIFRSIFLRGDTQHRLVMIGDPKQSIYAFRGADVNTYLEARQLEGACLYTLGRTFRSPAPLVSAVNAFFQRERSLLNPHMDFQPASSGLKGDTVLRIDGTVCESRIQAWRVEDADAKAYSSSGARNDRIAEATADEIARLLNHGEIEKDNTRRRVVAGDIAVLVSARYEADRMARALREAGVAAIVSTGENIMASEEAAGILALLRAVLTPRHSGLRNGALATVLLGYNSEDIARIQAGSELTDNELRRFTRWLQVWEKNGLASLLGTIDREMGIARRLATRDQGERRVTNFRHLCDLLQSMQRTLALNPAGIEGWLAGEIARATGDDSKTDDEERMLRLESDAHAVQIVTMHKSKGLEYNLVFCPFLWSPVKVREVEVLRAGGRRRPRVVQTSLWPAAHPEHMELFRAQLEDRLRLAYVALTRARVGVWLWCGAIGCVAQWSLAPSPLDWLLRARTPAPLDDAALAAWRASFDAVALPTGGKGTLRGAMHQAGLTALRAQAGDLIADLPPPAPRAYKAPARTQTLSAEELSSCPAPSVPPAWGVTSFSALTHEKHAHDTAIPVVSDEADPVTTSALQAAHLAAEAAEPPPCNAFLHAPAGAAVGTAVHEWLETWDFGLLDEAELQRHILSHHLPEPKPDAPGTTAELCIELMQHLRDARLQGLDCTIAEACPAPHGSEWHFHLPIRGTLDPRHLAAAFRTHGGPGIADYADALEQLSGEAVSGFLQGFIDRLVYHDGHWGVIDWKTNRLGEGPADYTQEGLLRCAKEAHYLLQAHLYLVALRRHLRLIGAANPPAGAWFVFLRAVHEGTSDGILHIVPPTALLDALDGLFA